MNYPNGKRAMKHSSNKIKQPNFSNRGMTLEEDIAAANEFYRAAGIAVVHKKPTPIQIVQVDYPKRSAAVIKEAYFKQASTTDFNGVYRGRYIDFEAKETRNKTSFPLSNIHQHQIDHMKSCYEHGGIVFLIIKFSAQDEAYLFPSEHLFPYWEDQLNDGRKSIPYQVIKEKGVLLPFHYQARIDYVKAIDKLYF
ncbi:Holliday junction resolvase RecU [Halobacillus massiliensis]|uniref:Holliday junction resolvase RecU n=1 Tax=Halobacillus massiliensis TaxID=1926286 RepID=UPI0009E411CC|nr:Holliday junction resolvase RecU [Halobacillus massiliensis]